MYKILIQFMLCLLISGGWEQAAAEEQKGEKRDIFVGKAADSQDWPYRYTLVRDKGQWSGEVEILHGEASLFFSMMNITSATDDKITFVAPFGRIGKALPTRWELSLSKSQTGFDGILIVSEGWKDFKPVRLEFIENKKAILPSSELEGKLRAMDDCGYRTDEALRHEVAIAKKAWEKESTIADRIAELRKDDSMRKGIRREWVGPAWVHARVKPEESKYFERICCIYVGGTAVTDQDVQAISQLDELRVLHLHRTGITDAALSHFDHLHGLRVLNLTNTHVSDAGLKHLRSLSNLKELYLFETKVSDEECEKLRKELLNAKVEW